MPATATGLTPSHIIRVSPIMILSFSSRDTNFSPSVAPLTTILPSSRYRKSKACNGCPSSIITKLVISTILFIARSPTPSSLLFIHEGEGFIFTFFITLAAYLGHSSGFMISTEVISLISSAPSEKTISGYLTVFPVMAAISHAIPTMLRQSERFGVIVKSSVTSLRSSASARSSPGFRSPGSIIIPEASSPISSSSSEQSIPSDNSPLIFECFTE